MSGKIEYFSLYVNKCIFKKCYHFLQIISDEHNILKIKMLECLSPINFLSECLYVLFCFVFILFWEIEALQYDSICHTRILDLEKILMFQ